MAKLRPEGQMRPIWPFDPAHHTCPIYIIIIILPFPAVHAFAQKNGVEQAKSILAC